MHLPYRRYVLALRAFQVASAALLLVSPFGGVAAGKPSDRATFVCDGEQSFVVEFANGHARLIAGKESYRLEKRRSSFGRRYASDAVAFMQDEDRAVLVGAEGGPYRNCRQRN